MDLLTDRMIGLISLAVGMLAATGLMTIGYFVWRLLDSAWQCSGGL